jgi:glycosyltransferase involved in cell wall biosynthesis
MVHPPRPLALPNSVSAQWPGSTRAPRISVVVPSFNQASFLPRTLDSILGQDYPGLELIVVDGGSTDGSPEVILRYADRLAWWVSEPDHGQADAINKGFGRASGDILAWINSDDLVAPGALHAVAQYFAANPNVDVVYGDRIVIDDQDRELGRWILPYHSRGILRWVDFVPQETLYWRRSIWERAGGRLDAGLQFALDWDLILRLLALNAHFVHLPQVLGLFRAHPAQKTRTAIRDTGHMEMQALRRRVLGFSPGRWRILCHVLPYLLAARLCELRRRSALGRSSDTAKAAP